MSNTYAVVQCPPPGATQLISYNVSPYASGLVTVPAQYSQVVSTRSMTPSLTAVCLQQAPSQVLIQPFTNPSSKPAPRIVTTEHARTLMPEQKDPVAQVLASAKTVHRHAVREIVPVTTQPYLGYSGSTVYMY
eukprot:NODE_1714_length_781_cov_297.579235_g1333_i0.p2 GENE.NODE_1714_length_781_cov_297.579235_g1333_i0~~NODE_1714_length_781_cov_297.579235_g1333_i0.p2  ORF type:complete len:133 (-),score=10.55 NODE_1714_length_781_cov_297.579235_g1333_i0:61-459(-)